MAGAEPASFVPPSVPSMALPTPQEMSSRGPWLYCQGRRVLLFAILGGRCWRASPCAMFTISLPQHSKFAGQKTEAQRLINHLPLPGQDMGRQDLGLASWLQTLSS